jgi:hypothetical protein
MGGLATAAVAAAAVAVTEAVEAADEVGWATVWTAGDCSCAVVAGRGAGAVEGEVVVSWCSDIAKTKSFLSQSWERKGVAKGDVRVRPVHEL